MESPGPGSEGPGSQLSREQLIEYVKKQKSRIKTLESQLASTEVPTDHHDNSETVQLRAFITELREAKSADETKILDLEQAVAALIEKLNNSSGTVYVHTVPSYILFKNIYLLP
jgi:cell division septum initiation protein DivIVA